MAVKLSTKNQIDLLEKIKRLADAGVMQNGITDQLILYGTKKEQEVGRECLNNLKYGRKLSSGLKKYLTKNAYLSLLSNEQTGAFSLGLSDAIDSLKLHNASTVEIIKVFRRPLAEIILVLAASAMASRLAFPLLERRMARSRWGFFSLAADNFGSFWYEHGISVGIGVILAGILLSFALKNWTD